MNVFAAGRERMPTCVRLRAQASAECQHLVSCMLQPNPAHRLSLDEVLAHPWVTCDMPQQLATLNARLLHVRCLGLAPGVSDGRVAQNLAAVSAAGPARPQLAGVSQCV